MGKRGPLPKLTIVSEELTDLNPPDWLGKEARAYWLRLVHFARDNKLLTLATVESFAVHCDLWQRLCDMRGLPTTRAYLDLRSAFATSCKHWRTIPSDAPSVKEDRHADKTDFKF